jgi:hypothetical protein
MTGAAISADLACRKARPALPPPPPPPVRNERHVGLNAGGNGRLHASQISTRFNGNFLRAGDHRFAEQGAGAPVVAKY